MAWNFARWCILSTYRTDSFMASVCWFFWFWHYFDLVKRVKFGVSGHILENAWREWPEILHADVSWPPSELISSGSRSVNFCNFGTILGFPVISRRTHGGNGLTYGMLLYPDHLQNWLDSGYGLVIFLILVLFWLSETGQIWGFQAYSGKPIEEMTWNFAFWCILTTFRTDKIMVTVCRFF